jgi:ABC-type branched-subunit amino acid transport system permease subunit
VSLCHIAFAAVGASTAARAVSVGFPWPLAVLLGGLVAIPIGALLAIPAIRLSGVYLAIATFGFGLVMQRLFYATIFMFGGTFAIRSPRPHFGVLRTHTDVGYYHVVLAVTVACCALVVLIRRSRMGRLLRAFADSPTAVDAHGTNTNELKVLVFSVSAFMAGIAGGLFAAQSGQIGYIGFGAFTSIIWLAVLALAGRGELSAGVIAAFVLAVLPSYVDKPAYTDWQPVIFGALAITASLAQGGALPFGAWLRRSAQRSAERSVYSPVRERNRLATAGAEA